MKRLLTASILSFFLAGAACAQVAVSDPWVRATVAAQSASGAFMTLTAARGARLVAARSPVAGVVEIHSMTLQDNVMRMRAIDALDLPAGKAVKLEPGGYHVMLMQLERPLKSGDTVPLELVIENADQSRETLQVDARVRALTSGHDKMKH